MTADGPEPRAPSGRQAALVMLVVPTAVALVVIAAMTHSGGNSTTPVVQPEAIVAQAPIVVSPSPSPSPSSSGRMDLDVARATCRTKIEEEIKASGTPQYVNTETVAPWDLIESVDGDAGWQFEGDLDAPDGFGALLRRGYMCEIAPSRNVARPGAFVVAYVYDVTIAQHNAANDPQVAQRARDFELHEKAIQDVRDYCEGQVQMQLPGAAFPDVRDDAGSPAQAADGTWTGYGTYTLQWMDRPWYYGRWDCRAGIAPPYSGSVRILS